MLRQLYFVPDIMERYRCRSKDTARRYMREVGVVKTETMLDGKSKDGTGGTDDPPEKVRWQ